LVISLDLSILYQWQLVPGDNEIKIKLSLPDSFDPNSITAALSDDRTALSITIPGEPPIVKGTLFAAAKSLSTAVSDNSLVYTLVKETPKEWGVLIKEFYPGTHEMDPCSLFMLWYQLQDDPETKGSEASLFFLSESVRYRFIPAMRVLYLLLSQRPETAVQAQALLITASRTYQDAESTMLLAALLSGQGMAREACQMFAMAADQGAIAGKSYVARYLSPVSGLDYPEKNLELAIRLLNEVRALQPDEPIACHELALLLYNGVGMERNEEQARALQEIALQTEPDTPPLTRGTAEGSWSIMEIAIGAVAAAVVFGGGVSLFRYLNRRK
jgi:hypothetical protein